jgi:hypothetical protein
VDDYIKLRVEPVIAAHGHAVQYVGDPDDELQTFGYTVGLAAQDIPEILIIAPLAPDNLIPIVNNAVQTIKSSSPLRLAGDYDEVIDGFVVRLREISVDAFAEYGLITSKWAYSHGITIKRALQIILPDELGRFPDEPHYNWVPVALLAPPAPPTPEQ